MEGLSLSIESRSARSTTTAMRAELEDLRRAVEALERRAESPGSSSHRSGPGARMAEIERLVRSAQQLDVAFLVDCTGSMQVRVQHPLIRYSRTLARQRSLRFANSHSFVFSFSVVHFSHQLLLSLKDLEQAILDA
jgi:hypothetical protein